MKSIRILFAAMIGLSLAILASLHSVCGKSPEATDYALSTHQAVIRSIQRGGTNVVLVVNVPEGLGTVRHTDPKGEAGWRPRWSAAQQAMPCRSCGLDHPKVPNNQCIHRFFYNKHKGTGLLFRWQMPYHSGQRLP